MPVFTATATALLSSTALAGSFIATNLLASGLAYGAGHLLGVFDIPEIGAAEDQGVELRLAANTQNRLPTLYGEWMERGRTVYAEVSDDKQNYHTVVALGEGPVDSIDRVFWNEYELTFDADGVVTDAVAPDGTSNDQYNGNITVQTYLGTATGNNSTYLEGLSDTWTSTDKMTNIVYAVISLKYNRDAGVTSLQDMRFVGTSPVSNPADAIQDLLTNTRYGLGLPSSDLNTDSFTAARTHYNDMVDYVDTDGVTVQQTRHEVNGSLSTSNDVVNRIQTIGRGCNTELTWSDGQWGLFVNKENSATSFEFNTFNIIGNVQVVEPGLNSLFNRIELNYGRNSENNYQRAEAFVEASAAVLYPNELTRTQTLDLPLVATSQEAKRVGTLNINQARQQLTVSHTADATAMPLEAGDVVRYTDIDYGWSNKLFRITSITEINEEASLTYQVTAIEYADAVYNFVVNEDDVAPNVPENDVAVIEAVDDLTVSGQFPNRSVPAIQLTWTVPDNSLIETFDIFFSIGGTQFNSITTVFAKSTIPAAGLYTSGDIITEEVSGVTAGNITFWVVGRNSFVSSTESNAVTVSNYQPNPTFVGSTIYRFNETPSVISGVNIDVGEPPANATGIGAGRNNNVNDTGWYESELDAANRENAPVWTAVTTVITDDASPRELDFMFSGTSGDTIITETPTNQIIDFDFTGTLGDRESLYAARPEVTQFTFTGQAAGADNVDPGLSEVWQIDVTGTTDATDGVAEQFYILPDGTSDGITATTIQVEVTEVSLDTTITLGLNLTGQALINDIETKLNAITSVTNQFTVTQETESIGGVDTLVIKLVSFTLEDLSLSLTISSGLAGTTSGTLVEGALNTTATSISIQYDPDIEPTIQMITFSANATSVEVAASLTNLIDGHGELTATQGDTFVENQELGSFSYIIPFDIPGFPGYDKESAFLTDPNVFPLVSPSFNSCAVNSLNLEAVTMFQSSDNDLVDILIVGNYLQLSNFPNFAPEGTWFLYEITDLDIIGNILTVRHLASSLDNLILDPDQAFGFSVGAGPPAAFISPGLITTSTTFTEDLTSSSILVKPSILGDQTEPVITINTQGTGDAAFAISTPLEGRNAIAGDQMFTSYSVMYDGVELFSESLISESDATSSANLISEAINDTTELSASAAAGVLTVTSTANSAADTFITITAGVNEGSNPSMNNLAASRAVTRLGSDVDVIAGEDTSVIVRVSGNEYYSASYNAAAFSIFTMLEDLEVGIDAIVPGFDNDERWDGDAFAPGKLTATAIGIGTTPTITLSVIAGSIATADSIGNITVTPATLSFTRTIVDSGVNREIASGELSNFTVVQGLTTLISAQDITGASSASSVVAQIASAISLVDTSQYTTSASDVNLLATLIMNGDTPDLTITIAPGLNTDDTAADLAVVKNVNQEGSVGTIDLTDADWDYFISSPTVDGDTTMLTPDGTIAVRRGLFLNSLAASRDGVGGSNTEVVFGSDLYTTASQPSIVDITGVLHFYVGITAASDDVDVTVQAIMQFTDDVTDIPNATWSDITGTRSNNAFAQVSSADARVGAQQYVSVSFASDNFTGLVASTQYAFRVLLRGVRNNIFVAVPNNVAGNMAATFQLQEILTTT